MLTCSSDFKIYVSLTKIYLRKKNFCGISALITDLRYLTCILTHIFTIFYTCYFQLQLVFFTFSVIILQGMRICNSICQNSVINFLLHWIILEGKGSFSLFFPDNVFRNIAAFEISITIKSLCWYHVFRSTYPLSSVLIYMRPTVVLFLSL